MHFNLKFTLDNCVIDYNFYNLQFMIMSFHHTDLTDVKYSGHCDQPFNDYLILITQLKLYMIFMQRSVICELVSRNMFIITMLVMP